jgi:hypothetical protein
MADVKAVNISGGAADDYLGGARKKKRTTCSKKKGGAMDELHGVSPVMNAVKGVDSSMSVATTAGSPQPSTWLRAPTTPVPPAIVPHPSTVPATLSQVAAPTNQYQTGGVKHIKVELKKKATAKKVHLHPKKAEISKHPAQKKHHTRKARKITLGLSSLHKRMTRAKKVHKKIKEMPLDELKSQLVQKKLIKPTSKAPESVLRQIAADAQIVAGKAL